MINDRDKKQSKETHNEELDRNIENEDCKGKIIEETTLYL